jgi:tape measure domain-containing protein
MSIVVGDVQFVFRATTIGLNSAIREINKVNAAIRGYGTGLNRVTVQKQRYTGVQQKFTRNTQIQSAAVYELVKSLQIMLGPLSGVASRVSALAMLFQSGGGIAGSFLVMLSGVTAGFGLMQHQLIKTELAMEALNARFTSVGLGGQKFGETMEFVTDLSRNLGLDLQTTAASYSKLTAAAQGSALEGQGVKNIFIAVSEASAALRLSVDQTTGAFKAIEQMISKGTIQAEELRGQLGERIYGAFQRTARAMGVNTKELGRMLKAGEALSEDVLPKLAKELHKTFEEVAKANALSLRGSFNTLMTELTLFYDKIIKLSMVSDIWGETLRNIAVRIRDFTGNDQKMEDLAHKIGFATDVMAKSLMFLMDHFREIKTIIVSILTIIGARGFVTFFDPFGKKAQAATEALKGVEKGVKGVEAGAATASLALTRFWSVAAAVTAYSYRDEIGTGIGEALAKIVSGFKGENFQLISDNLEFMNASYKDQLVLLKDLEDQFVDLQSKKGVNPEYLKRMEELIALRKTLLNIPPPKKSKPGFDEDGEGTINIYEGALEQLTAKFEEVQAAANVTKAALMSGFSEETLAPIGKFLQQFKDGDVLVLPKELEEALAKVDALIKRSAKDKVLEEMLNSAKTETDKLKESLDKANASRDYLIMKGAVTDNSEFSKQLEILDAHILKITKDLNALTNFSLKENLEALEPKDIAKELKDVFESTRTEAEKFNDELLRLKFFEKQAPLIFKDAKELEQVMEALRRKTVELGEEYDKTTERGKMIAEITDTVKEAMDELGKSIADSFVDSISEGTSALEAMSDAFGNILKNIAKQVMQFAIQIAVVKPLIDWLFGAGTYGGTKAPGATGVLDGLLKKLIPATAAAVVTKTGATSGATGASIETATRGATGTIVNGLNACCACCKGGTSGWNPDSLVGKTIQIVGAFDRAEQNKMFDRVGSIIANGIPGFASGADFKIGGAGGTDSKLVQFMGTPGERVRVTPPSKNYNDGGTVPTINLTIHAPGADAGTLARMKEIVHSEIVPQVIPAAHRYTMNQLKRPRFV